MNRKIIALGFEGDYWAMTLEEALQEIKDNAQNDCGGYEDYVEDNKGETIDDYVNFKSECAMKELEQGYIYEYCGVEYNILDDDFIEEQWNELGNIPFDEQDYGDMIIAENWFLFDKGTNREEIWHWFDENYSKGIAYLLYKCESEEN